jgi:Dolichyl-phosphate-mannose-protein mannosyltransferase
LLVLRNCVAYSSGSGMPDPSDSGAVGTMPSASPRTPGASLAAVRSLVDSRTGAALCLLVLGCALLRGYWTTWIPTPWINGDETIYALLARSLWHSGHLSILGAPTPFYSAVYPALIGGLLSLPKVALGYSLVKWLQALVMTFGAVPVYLWGRRLASPGWGLVAAALTLTLPGLAYSGLLMTEVAFFPAVVLAAWRIARTLESPSLANQALMAATIGLAVATRVQALVLVLAYPTALALKLVFDRVGFRSLRSHAPALGALLALTGGWTAWQLATGDGAATDVFGAYRAAGEAPYSAWSALRFVVYHVADVVLLTGVVPACAVVLLLPRVRELSTAGRAYLATTLGLTFWFVLEVGIFASRLVGTVAERNLFPLAPLFFLGLVVWLSRGAPRPRFATGVVVAAVIALVAVVPAHVLNVDAVRWESFTLIAFYDLHVWQPTVSLRPLLVASVLPLLALLVFVPPKRLWLVPTALVVLLAVLSGVATATTITQARYETKLVGQDKRWIDRSASGPVDFLTGGEALWPSVYENIFWNRSIKRVSTLPGFAVPGPLPQTPVGPLTDGRIVDASGRPLPTRFVVASNTLTLFGEKLRAPKRAKLVLWRVQPPLRLSTWVTGLSIVTTGIDPRGDLSVAGGMGSDAKLVAYACSGAFKVKLVGHGVPTTVTVRTNGKIVDRARLEPWHALEKTFAALPRGSAHTSQPGVRPACDLEIRSSAGLDARLELQRAG